MDAKKGIVFWDVMPCSLVDVSSCCLLLPCLTYSSTLRIDAVGSSQKSVNFYTRLYGVTSQMTLLFSHCRKDLESHATSQLQNTHTTHTEAYKYLKQDRKVQRENTNILTFLHNFNVINFGSNSHMITIIRTLGANFLL